jgi:hypothetical protein
LSQTGETDPTSTPEGQRIVGAVRKTESLSMDQGSEYVRHHWTSIAALKRRKGLVDRPSAIPVETGKSWHRRVNFTACQLRPSCVLCDVSVAAVCTVSQAAQGG